jgi:hypothetical protein
MGWISGYELMVWEHGPKAPIAIFANASRDIGIPPDGKWHTIDVSDKVPEGTKAINISGLLIISHGQNNETANLRLYLRRNNQTNPGYNYQAISALRGSGIRSPMSSWVSLTPKYTFDVKWLVTNADGKWPAYSAYGMNLTINAVLR